MKCDKKGNQALDTCITEEGPSQHGGDNRRQDLLCTVSRKRICKTTHRSLSLASTVIWVKDIIGEKLGAHRSKIILLNTTSVDAVHKQKKNKVLND